MLHSVDWLLLTDVSRKTFRFHLQGLSGLLDPWRWDPVGCPETSVTNHQSTLRNIPEDRLSKTQRQLRL